MRQRGLPICHLMAAVFCIWSTAACVQNDQQRGGAPTVDEDIDFPEAVQVSELLFLGSLAQLHKSDCFPSGSLAPSMQALTFNVTEVIRGKDLPNEITVERLILGSGYLEVERGGCIQLSPSVFQIGEHFIVACSYSGQLSPEGTCVLGGGPWPDTPENRRAVLSVLDKSTPPSESPQ